MSHCWIIGAGYMAKEYAKALIAMKKPFTVAGRSSERLQQFESDIGGENITATIEGALERVSPNDVVIVAISTEALAQVSSQFIRAGAKRLLIEKPAIMDIEQLNWLLSISASHQASCYVAYNRRFFESVRVLRERAALEGGIDSFSFEFTEWTERINLENYSQYETEHWIWLNSYHVIDLAFHLGGFPQSMDTYRSGEYSWHPAGTRFCGSGVTESNALFNYIANWNAPGRWGLEFSTPKTRYVLRPMEKLQIVSRNSVAIEEVTLQEFNVDIKPGIFAQTKAVLEGEGIEHLCKLEDQRKSIEFCNKIAGYWKIKD